MPKPPNPADPRDSLDRCVKPWEEFRAGFASAFLMTRMARDLEKIAPTYVRDLGFRFDQARDSVETFRQGLEGMMTWSGFRRRAWRMEWT